MRGEGLLDLQRCDRLAAAADQVVEPTGDREKAIGVDLDSVARPVPTVLERGGRRRRVVEVAVEHHSVAHLQLAAGGAADLGERAGGPATPWLSIDICMV